MKSEPGNEDYARGYELAVVTYKYTFRFQGRRANRFGNTHHCEVTVEAETRAEAMTALHDTHEHISQVRLVDCVPTGVEVSK